MTIDERLDRLTERHEALTQTVEILAATTCKALRRFFQGHSRRHGPIAAHSRRSAKTASLVWKLANICNEAAQNSQAMQLRRM